MKITKIEKQGDTFTVTFTPNFVNKLFGYKERIKLFKRTGRKYSMSGGNVYINKEGEILECIDTICEKLDSFTRAF